jgi:hypothetical protein
LCWGLVVRIVSDLADPSNPIRKVFETWNPDQIHTFLNAGKHHPAIIPFTGLPPTAGCGRGKFLVFMRMTISYIRPSTIAMPFKR